MTEVVAAVARRGTDLFSVECLQLEEPRPGEARVRIVGAGICHTDLGLRPMATSAGAVVLGHEGAGVVEAVGEGVTGVKPGDRVIASFEYCGSCVPCRTGHVAYCTQFGRNFLAARADMSTSLTDDDGQRVGSHFFGQSSFASHALVGADQLVKMPDDLPLEVAGPLGCGVLTGAGSVLEVLKPPAGSSLVVFGAGAVGLSAIMAAAAVGCSKIVAVDLLESRLAMATELGATHVVDAQQRPGPLKTIAKGGFDFAFDTTGSPAVIRQAVDSLSPTGVCGLVGMPSDMGVPLTLDPMSLMGRTVRGIIEGDAVPADLIPRLVRLWRAGRFPFDRMIRTYPVGDVNQAVDDLGQGKAVKAGLTFNEETP